MESYEKLILENNMLGRIDLVVYINNIIGIEANRVPMSAGTNVTLNV
jgi:hypothetical protein